MGYQFSQTDIQVHNPYPANEAFRLVYEVEVTDTDDPGHYDYVQMWGSDGTKWLDQNESAPETPAGGRYGVFIDIPALPAGYYDISITLPDGTAAGATIIVEDPAGSGSGSGSGSGDEYGSGSGDEYGSAASGPTDEYGGQHYESGEYGSGGSEQQSW